MDLGADPGVIQEHIQEIQIGSMNGGMIVPSAEAAVDTRMIKNQIQKKRSKVFRKVQEYIRNCSTRWYQE